MVRLIMGANGAGKTKQLIELIHTSVESETGSVVCIEPKGDMTYDVSYNVRLVNAGEYNVDSFDCLRGFLCGMYAGNYDISHVFVDNLCKIAGSNDLQAVETFLHWLDRFSEENGVKFTVTISADEDTATEGMKQYIWTEQKEPARGRFFFHVPPKGGFLCVRADTVVTGSAGAHAMPADTAPAHTPRWQRCRIRSPARPQ